jgi:ABC-2 type transport system ATP-binding protein
MIQIESLVKAYDSFKAVDGLSLHVEAGQILGLVGPNGAGKTTTLRCLAGIIPPTSGRIAIGGLDLERDRVEARRQVAFVPDEPRLFDYLTAWDHLLVVTRLYGVADGHEKARRLLSEFDLEERRYAYPDELSRGMKQKLMVALALLHDPKVLILDEPLTGLDPAAMRRMKQTIVASARQGAAAVVSSHMLHLVEEICDRILILQRGQKVMEGTLAEIRAGLPDLHAAADLEEIFLRATGEETTQPAGNPDRKP